MVRWRGQIHPPMRRIVCTILAIDWWLVTEFTAKANAYQFHTCDWVFADYTTEATGVDYQSTDMLIDNQGTNLQSTPVPSHSLVINPSQSDSIQYSKPVEPRGSSNQEAVQVTLVKAKGIQLAGRFTPPFTPLVKQNCESQMICSCVYKNGKLRLCSRVCNEHNNARECILGDSFICNEYNNASVFLETHSFGA